MKTKDFLKELVVATAFIVALPDCVYSMSHSPSDVCLAISNTVGDDQIGNALVFKDGNKQAILLTSGTVRAHSGDLVARLGNVVYKDSETIMVESALPYIDRKVRKAILSRLAYPTKI